MKENTSFPFELICGDLRVRHRGFFGVFQTTKATTLNKDLT